MTSSTSHTPALDNRVPDGTRIINATLLFDVAGLLVDRGFYDGTSIERLDAVASVALPIVRGGEQMAEKLNTTVFH